MALVRHCLRTLWMEMLLNTITDHPLLVADKLFSQADQSDIKVGPAVEEEEEPQKEEDKGISELSLMLDQAHQQTLLVEVLHWML